MVGLVVVGVVAGFLAGISPCILPVLPVVLVAGVTRSGSGEADAAEPRWRLARPLAVVGGLVLSFSLLILAGSEIISLLHLPADSLRDAGIALLALVGLGYLILALGVLYVPCAGPVLAAITVVGATHRVGLTAIFVTAGFAVGTAVPLLAVAIAGGQLSGRIGALRRHAPAVRQIGGAVLVVMAVAIAFNVFDGLQRDVPSYSSALQGGKSIRKELNTLTGVRATTLTSCDSNAIGLVDCGQAPNFTGITAWLNTPGGKPLSMSSLRGKVVLVDFWTYSCINCQRT